MNPQTAAPIHQPPTGQVSLKPGIAPTKPKPRPHAVPATHRDRLERGSWNLRDLKDTRENIVEAIRAAAFVPEPWKLAMINAIESTHAKARLIRLDAHCQILTTPRGKKHILTLDISEL